MAHLKSVLTFPPASAEERALASLASHYVSVRQQTDALSGIGQINDSGVRILHAARALRKVAVGR